MVEKKVNIATELKSYDSQGYGIGRYGDLEFDKLRGGYYTSAKLSKWLATWAIRDKDNTVLEPSCGDGSFLESAIERLLELYGSTSDILNQLTGIEIVPDEVEFARNRLSNLSGLDFGVSVIESDFFDWWLNPNRGTYDVVIGNPPFIRYQSFPEPYRSRAMSILVKLGMKPNKLTNIWVPFVAAASACLKPGGRMALILPSELLQVSYASQLRSFLTDHFSKIDIVTCNELFFENAEQEVVLLLAENANVIPSFVNNCQVTLTETDSLTNITDYTPFEVIVNSEPKILRHDSEKWLKYFLSSHEINLMRELRESGIATTLSTHASIDVGIVTGRNEFFVLSSQQVEEFGLEGYTIPIISRSAQIKGAIITKDDWNSLAFAGRDRIHLLQLNSIDSIDMKKELISYIQKGETAGFQTGYKCSIRNPWYIVPSVWIPDGLLFRQIYDFPRLVLNQAGVCVTDTIHRLRTNVSKELFISNFYTHLTAASAEIEGRSYGGGVLELEPSEAEHLLVPTKLVKALSIEEIDFFVRRGELSKVLEHNNKLVLIEGMGLTKNDCQTLFLIWEKMRNRRMNRKRVK